MTGGSWSPTVTKKVFALWFPATSRAVTVTAVGSVSDVVRGNVYGSGGE